MNRPEEIFLAAINDIKKQDYFNAEIKLKKAYQILPDNLAVIVNLSSSLQQNLKLEEADFYINKGLRLYPKSYDLLLNKTGILTKQKKLLEVIKILEEIKIFEPNRPEAYFNLSRTYINFNEYVKSFENIKEAVRLTKNPKYFSFLLFSYNFHPYYSDKIYKQYSDEFRKSLTPINKDYLKITKYQKGAEIKLGFLGSDIQDNHPVGYFLNNFLEKIKTRYKIYSYFNNYAEKENFIRIKSLFHEWRNVRTKSDNELINLIKEDGIHILIDVNGHTDNNRLPIYINRVAPIQMTWAACLNSTGIPEIDYIIGDPIVTPLDSQEKFAEKILQMPDVWACFSKPEYKDLQINKITPAIKNKFVTFGNLNISIKITQEVIRVFSEILSIVPNSKIIFAGKNFGIAEFKKNFIKNFTDLNISEERIIIHDPLPRKQLLELYNEIDICLDTFPYGGGTTSFESAYMGVPLLTLKGDTFLHNCGSSINNNLDMKEWITLSRDEYIKKAFEFSSNIEKLNKTRSELHEKAIGSPLFDANKFALNFDEKIKTILAKL